MPGHLTDINWYIKDPVELRGLQSNYWMENRTTVIKELFELRLLLNKSNKLANQQTELDFSIVDDEFIAFVSNEDNPSFILLSKKRNTNGKWQLSSTPYCYFLKTFISNELNNVQKELKTYLKDPKDINEILLFHMKKLLRGLLIEKFD